MLIASLLTAAITAAMPPRPGALAFGSSPAAVKAVLGKPTGQDVLDDFTWVSYPVGRGLVRVAYYHDRVSQFTVMPGQLLTQAQARGWGRAFFPGLDKGRTNSDSGRTLVFGTFVMVGRPFEAMVHLDGVGEQFSAVGGEIHWLD